MEARTVTLNLYRPHALQRKFHNSKARFRVAATGRQFGKSTMANMEMLRKAWENPGTKYAFISPVFSQAKEQYRRMISFLPPDVITRKSDTELRIDLITGSYMEYLSGDNPHSLRGKTLDGVLVDEVRDQHPDLWRVVIRPMITTTGGWAVFISTPNGFDSFYDLSLRAQTDKNWEFFTGPSTCNPLFTQEEFESAKKDMSEAQFAQEILAEFRDLTKGKAYITFTDANIVEQNPFAKQGEKWCQHLPIILAPDFNLHPMAWGLGQVKEGLPYWHWADEIYLENSYTQEASMVAVEKLRNHRAGVVVCGDASAYAGQRAAAGQSDYDILMTTLKDAGIRVENRTPDCNPTIRDRVNTMNSLFKSAKGEVRQSVSPDCRYMIKDFQRVVWQENQQKLSSGSDGTLTHSSDGPGYAACELTPLHGVSQVGVPRLVRRR